MLVGEQVHAWREGAAALYKSRNDRSLPPQLSVLAERNVLIGSRSETPGARQKFAFQAAHRRGAQGSHLNAFGSRICGKVKPLKLSDDLATDRDSTGVVKHEIERLVLAEPAPPNGRAPVDETLREAFVQRIGKAVFDRTGHALPMSNVAHPARPMRRVRPCTDLRKPPRECGDVSFGLIEAHNLAREPLVRKVTVGADQMRV